MQRDTRTSPDHDRLLQLNEGYIAAYLKADVGRHRQARGNFTRPDGSTGTSRYTDIWVRTAKDGWKTVSAQITRSAH